MPIPVLVVLVIAGLSILLCLFCLFMLFRNDWVYEKRKYLLDNDYQKYCSLPSYNVMMRKFWIWDVEKFVDEE